MPDVLVGYVHTGEVAEQWMRSLFGVFNHDQNRHLQDFVSGYPDNIAESRCDVVEQFLARTEYEWLWFIDTDIVFPPDTLDRLLEVADPKDRPIVTAAYWRDYSEGGRWLVWKVFHDDRLRVVAEMPDDLLRISVCGMGCVLIHRCVLERIGDEFKDDPWPWFGHDVMNTHEGPRRLGEDYTFCARAAKCEFPIYGAPIPVEHRKVTTLGLPKEPVAA